MWRPVVEANQRIALSDWSVVPPFGGNVTKAHPSADPPLFGTPHATYHIEAVVTHIVQNSNDRGGGYTTFESAMGTFQLNVASYITDQADMLPNLGDVFHLTLKFWEQGDEVMGHLARISTTPTQEWIDGTRKP